MTYITGTASNFLNLRDDIISNCSANGWTSSGNVLWKGNSYFALHYTTGAHFIYIHGGTGLSSGTLTNECSSYSRLGGSYFTFPISYEINIFTNPDEVYVVVNYNSNYYQQLSFGTSDVMGSGYGPWFTGALTSSTNNYPNVMYMHNYTYSIGLRADYNVNSNNSLGFFEGSPDYGSSYVYTTATGAGEWKEITAGELVVTSANGVASLLNSLPSPFNSTNVLLPIKSFCDMGSGGVATVVNLKNARFCRIDYNEAGQIVIYGSDKWKVYPWLKKNLNLRGGGTSVDHSGTYGYAIRYSGP